MKNMHFSALLAAVFLASNSLAHIDHVEDGIPEEHFKLGRSGTISACTSGEDAAIKRIDTVDYPMSFELDLDPGDGCYHLVFNTAFAIWPDTSRISAAVARYSPPADHETAC